MNDKIMNEALEEAVGSTMRLGLPITASNVDPCGDFSRTHASRVSYGRGQGHTRALIQMEQRSNILRIFGANARYMNDEIAGSPQSRVFWLQTGKLFGRQPYAFTGIIHELDLVIFDGGHEELHRGSDLSKLILDILRSRVGAIPMRFLVWG